MNSASLMLPQEHGGLQPAAQAALLFECHDLTADLTQSPLPPFASQGGSISL